MQNIIDYISWRGDLSFRKDPFNEVDNLIFSEIVYLDYSPVVPSFESKDTISLHKAMKALFKDKEPKTFKGGLLFGSDSAVMADLMAKHHRYKHIKICKYVNCVEPGMQFSATSFVLNHDLIYISFKGTDDTLIGWQEDFMMTYKFPVPAQKAAVDYVRELMKEYPGHRFILGGHSKGGNVAVYAATYLEEELQDRIEHVYSNDGPGFIPGTLDEEKFKRIKDKCTLIVPQDSIVGRFFERHIEDVQIVFSNKKGLNQHDGFSWSVMQKEFVRCKSFTNKSNEGSKQLASLIYDLSLEEREKLGEDIGEYIIDAKVGTLSELTGDVLNSLRALRKFRLKNKKTFNTFVTILLRNRLL